MKRLCRYRRWRFALAGCAVLEPAIVLSRSEIGATRIH